VDIALERAESKLIALKLAKLSLVSLGSPPGRYHTLGDT